MKKLLLMMAPLLFTACNSIQVIREVKPASVLQIQFDEGGTEHTTSAGGISLQQVKLEGFTSSLDGLRYVTVTYDVTNTTDASLHNLGFRALNLDDADSDPNNQSFPLTFADTPFTQVKDQQGNDASGVLTEVMLRGRRTQDPTTGAAVQDQQGTRFVELLEKTTVVSFPVQGIREEVKNESWVLDGDLAPGQTRQIQFTLSYPLTQQGPLDFSLLVTPVEKMPDPKWHAYPSLPAGAREVKMDSRDRPVVVSTVWETTLRVAQLRAHRWTGQSWEQLGGLIQVDPAAKSRGIYQFEVTSQNQPVILLYEAGALYLGQFEGNAWTFEKLFDAVPLYADLRVRLTQQGKAVWSNEARVEVWNGLAWVPVTGPYTRAPDQTGEFVVGNGYLDAAGVPLILGEQHYPPEGEDPFDVKLARWEDNMWKEYPTLTNGNEVFTGRFMGSMVFETTRAHQPAVTFWTSALNGRVIILNGIAWNGSRWLSGEYGFDPVCTSKWGDRSAVFNSNSQFVVLGTDCSNYQVYVSANGKDVPVGTRIQGKNGDIMFGSTGSSLDLDRNDRPVLLLVESYPDPDDWENELTSRDLLRWQ